MRKYPQGKNLNPYAAGGLFGQYKMMQKTETLANWYSYESTQWELSNGFQYDRVPMFSKKICILHPFTLDESSLSIGRVEGANPYTGGWLVYMLCCEDDKNDDDIFSFLISVRTCVCRFNSSALWQRKQRPHVKPGLRYLMNLSYHIPYLSE